MELPPRAIFLSPGVRSLPASHLLVPAPRLFPARPGHRERWQTSDSPRPHPGRPCALQPGMGPARCRDGEGVGGSRRAAGRGARGERARAAGPGSAPTLSGAGRAADPAPLHTWPGIAALTSGIAPGPQAAAARPGRAPTSLRPGCPERLAR